MEGIEQVTPGHGNMFQGSGEEAEAITGGRDADEDGSDL